MKLKINFEKLTSRWLGKNLGLARGFHFTEFNGFMGGVNLAPSR